MKFQHIGMIGYGEVGKTFAAGLKPQVATSSTWDVKLISPVQRTELLAHAESAGVGACLSMAELCQSADLLISAVTASNTLAVAQAAAAHLQVGCVFLDLNSASPATKQQAAAVINQAGGRYVEAGVMTSVPPYGIRVPMLLGGAAGAELAAVLTAWGLNARCVSDTVGVASAIKMCRSVMIKGLEALVIESYATARAYGVEDHVLPTLVETFPSIDWSAQGAYFFSRVVQHGKRRAEEIREAANTVKEAGFEPFMARAIADKQQWVADQAAAGVFAKLAHDPQDSQDGKDPKSATWQAYADCLLSALPSRI